MASGTSRGKQSFREFTKAANQLKRLTERAIKAGEQYTADDIEDWYNELLSEYERSLYDEDIPNPELWMARANGKASDDTQYLINAYSLYEETDTEGSAEDEETDNEEFGPEEIADSIMGIPVITENECIDNGNSARGQILLTWDELVEYLEPIPPSVINGLIPVYDENGNIQGYRLCGAKNT